jgi:RimJ/RimL family protein N-acetyltransferase
MIMETERLQLRGFSVDDLDSIYELVYANPVVKDAWSGRQGTPEEIKRVFAEDWIATKSEYGLKALELKETASLVGLMGFQRHMPDEDNSWVVIESDPGHKVGGDPAFIEAELTYALGRSYWGNGYATEMGRKLVEFGFTALGIRRIINSVRANNEHSIGLMRRLGFRIEANNASTPPGINGILDANIPSLHP